MHQSIFLFFLLASQISVAQLKTNVAITNESSLNRSEVIYYDPEEDLIWDNFNGKPEEVGNEAAVTVSGFGYKAGIKSKNGKGELNISVYCYFNKNKSWVKPGREVSYILNHEQHHFDISFIASRIFLKKLQEANFTLDNYKALLPGIYEECSDILNKMQEDYDGETHNGQLETEQTKWNERVAESINSFTK